VQVETARENNSDPDFVEESALVCTIRWARRRKWGWARGGEALRVTKEGPTTGENLGSV